jgi:hypothetical protein
MAAVVGCDCVVGVVREVPWRGAMRIARCSVCRELQGAGGEGKQGKGGSGLLTKQVQDGAEQRSGRRALCRVRADRHVARV